MLSSEYNELKVFATNFNIIRITDLLPKIYVPILFDWENPIFGKSLLKMIKIWNRSRSSSKIKHYEFDYLLQLDYYPNLEKNFSKKDIQKLNRNQIREYSIKNGRMNYKDFYYLYNDFACAEWLKMDRSGNPGYNDNEFDNNGRLLYELEFPHPVILWAMKYLCYHRNESVDAVEKLCNWTKNKMNNYKKVKNK